MLSASERAAQRVLTPAVYDYYAGGSGDGSTVADERCLWDDVRFVPRVLRDVSSVSTTVTVLGSDVAGPAMLAPTAAHVLAHPDGEVATARAAKAANCLLVLSMRSSTRLEDVAAAAGPWWQQVYILGDRGVSDEVARRAAAAGARALVLTVDTPYLAGRTSTLPSCPIGVVAELDGRDPADLRLAQSPSADAADIQRLTRVSGLPVVVKGVLRGDEAARCLDAGAVAVIVSSHGGRQMDGVIPVHEALREVLDTVGDRCEVYVDGGIRSGRDVLRAVAIGARAVLVGRPVLWGLAVGGSAGVRDVLLTMHAELNAALGLAGCTSCDDAGADIVRWPRRY